MAKKLTKTRLKKELHLTLYGVKSTKKLHKANEFIYLKYKIDYPHCIKNRYNVLRNLMKLSDSEATKIILDDILENTICEVNNRLGY